jgi:hypothetical protein
MITKVFTRMAPALLIFVSVSPTLAGEVGVSNSWSSSARHGTGQSWGDMKSSRQENGHTTTFAAKFEVGSLPPTNESIVGQGSYFAVSGAKGSSAYSQFTTTSFGESRHFGFTDTSNSHSVSSFAN